MDDLKTYYCKRIKSNVIAEEAGDILGEIYVQCKHYKPEGLCDYFDPLCNGISPKKCLVKLTVQREIKKTTFF